MEQKSAIIVGHTGIPMSAFLKIVVAEAVQVVLETQIKKNNTKINTLLIVKNTAVGEVASEIAEHLKIYTKELTTTSSTAKDVKPSIISRFVNTKKDANLIKFGQKDPFAQIREENVTQGIIIPNKDGAYDLKTEHVVALLAQANIHCFNYYQYLFDQAIHPIYNSNILLSDNFTNPPSDVPFNSYDQSKSLFG